MRDPPPRSSPSGTASASAASDSGLTLAPLVETDSITLFIRFVSAGLGVAFLPRFSATIQEARGELVVVAVDEPLLMNASPRCIVRARRRLSDLTVAVAAFLSGGMAAFG